MRDIATIRADMHAAEDAGDFKQAARYSREWASAEADVQFWWENLPIERKQELCNAYRDGLAVILPCKVGDTVFHIANLKMKTIVCGEIYAIHTTNSRDDYIKIRGKNTGKYCCKVKSRDFGKTVFPTREAAEAALKERDK